jgi:hypothetical protein
MSKKPANKNQAILPGMEQALCACGCNTYFMRVSRGRKRLYLNDTHKKRVARRKAEARRTETRVFLTPKGIWTAEELAGARYDRVWELLTLNEQWVYELSRQHPAGTFGFWEAVNKLQRRAKAGMFTLDEALNAEYEND